MDEAKFNSTKSWLIKARNDLASAKKLAGKPEPCLDTAIYHCQQTGEKALKAFLVFHDRVFEKTHDLRLLVNLAEEVDSRFHDCLKQAALLVPYATEYRYPGEFLEPEPAEFHEALDAASRLYEFVLSLLPQDFHPRVKNSHKLSSFFFNFFKK